MKENENAGHFTSCLIVLILDRERGSSTSPQTTGRVGSHPAVRKIEVVVVWPVLAGNCATKRDGVIITKEVLFSW